VTEIIASARVDGVSVEKISANTCLETIELHDQQFDRAHVTLTITHVNSNLHPISPLTLDPTKLYQVEITEVSDPS
jgi:hypothetical protein